jgi:predicted glycogen debranching enzyme
VLVHNADLLKYSRDGRKRICAGFSWLDAGLLRETVVSLPGLTLYADGDCAEFEEILDNLIADNEERLYRRTTQVEAPLRIADVLQQYIAFAGGEKDVWKKYGKVMCGIIESYAPGVRKEVGLHPNGLLWAQMDRTALSWMNAYVDGYPVTERAGYQVDTNAWWYNALCFALEMEEKYGAKKNDFVNKWSKVRDLAKANFQATFYNESKGYLADYVDNAGGHFEVRPNQMVAVYVPYSPVDDEVKSQIMSVVKSELVTKRGLRTLSPRNVNYRGVYEGSQRDRDLAYHQGCTRPELLGAYIDINFKMVGPAFVKKAEYLLEGFLEDISKHGVGAFSELYDGDPPHEPHGAISSACATASLLWSEYLIAVNKLEK